MLATSHPSLEVGCLLSDRKVEMDSLMAYCVWCLEIILIMTSGIVADLLEQPYDPNILASIYDDTDGRQSVTPAAGPGGGGGGARGGQDALRDWMMQSIKKKILAETGRGGHVTGSVPQTTGEMIGQVREVIAFADNPVSMATDNGTLEFTLRPNRTTQSRHHHHFRVDNAAMFVRISTRRPPTRHQVRHLRHRAAATISLTQLTGAREPAHVPTVGQAPLPIATASIRVRSVGWQEVPLPSSVVQDVLDSADPVLRVRFVCENCEVAPTTSHPTGSRRGSDGHARRRHGNDLPYLTITTSTVAAEI